MTIESHPETYGEAAGMPAPVPLAPGPVQPGGTSPIDGATSGFGAVTNADLGTTNGEITADDEDRRAHAADAAAKFPANEADSAQQLEGVGTEQMAQMIPQMASGLAGAVGGAFGGILGPLTQLPQQAMQAGQGALQPLMSAMQTAGDEGLESGLGDGLGEFGDAELLDSAGGGGGAGDIGGGGGGTTPTGYLGPPPVPTSSPPTTPAGAPTKPLSAAPTDGTPPAAGSRGMAGMPMVPPGAMGAGGKDGSKDKPGDKRVTVPGVPNGQPVKGRLTTPPNVPVTKSAEGKPVVRRRILLPDHTERGRSVPDEKADGVD